MLLTASFSFANSEVVVKSVEVVSPVTTVVVATAESLEEDTCSITLTIVVNGYLCTGTGTAEDCDEAYTNARNDIDCKLIGITAG